MEEEIAEERERVKMKKYATYGDIGELEDKLEWEAEQLRTAKLKHIRMNKSYLEYHEICDNKKELSFL